MLAAQPCFGAITNQDPFEWECIVFNALRVAMHSIADGVHRGKEDLFV